MTDTSGRSGFGPAGAKIRTDLRRRFGGRRKRPRPDGSSGKPATFESSVQLTIRSVPPPEKAPDGIPEMIPIVREVFWTHLADRLDRVLLPPELLYYLESMARVIETAASGTAAVAAAFEIRETSTFFTLRRSISSRAPGRSDSDVKGSEHQTRAATAFNRATIKLADELTGIDDPTQVTLSMLVDEIRKGDTAPRTLVRSARLILQEYGQLVLCRPIRDDDPWRNRAKNTVIAGFRAQLSAFFAKHHSAAEWREAAIEKTLRDFPPFVNTGRGALLVR